MGALEKFRAEHIPVLAEFTIVTLGCIVAKTLNKFEIKAMFAIIRERCEKQGMDDKYIMEVLNSLLSSINETKMLLDK